MPTSYLTEWTAGAESFVDACAPDDFFASSVWWELFSREIPAQADQVRFYHSPEHSTMLPLWVKAGAPRRWMALCNYYASLYGPVAGDDSVVVRGLADIVGAITRQAAPALIALNPLSAEAPSTTALEQAFHHNGWWVQRHVQFGNWYEPCSGVSFEDYMARRPSRVRNTVKRKGRQFFSMPGARLEIIADAADVERGIAAYQAVYAASWKQPEPYPDFVPELLRACARQGLLRLGVAWLGERPLAAQIWIVYRRKALIYKLAYDEEFKKLTTGTLLTRTLMERVLDQDRVLEIDYLTGDDDYKKDWMTRRRERVGLLAFNPRTLTGLMQAALHFGGRALKRFIQRIKPS